jgi:hypothetical protein
VADPIGEPPSGYVTLVTTGTPRVSGATCSSSSSKSTISEASSTRPSPRALRRCVLEANGILYTMCRKGDCWDNACAESIFATHETERIHRQPRPTRIAAQLGMNEYIGVFCDGKRRHPFLGTQSPVDFEDAFHEVAALAASATCPGSGGRSIPGIASRDAGRELEVAVGRGG